MNLEIGSFEAKTKWSELLRGVQAGMRYTITMRGQPVADLVPSAGSAHKDPEAAVSDMLQFMQAAEPEHGLDLKALVDEGRA